MSDREGHSGGGALTDEDLSLPKATVAKMIAGAPLSTCFTSEDKSVLTINALCAELLPSDVVCAKETRDLVIECCVGEHGGSMFIGVHQHLTHVLFHRIHSFNIIGSE